MNKYLLNIICWGIFGLVWIIGGIYNYYKVPVLNRRINFIKIWPFVLIISWYIGKQIHVSIWAKITYNTSWLSIVGAIILIIFTIFTIWSRVILGRMWASDAVIKEGHKLRTKGPYSITRHPIYTGMVGMMLGSTFMNGFGLALFILTCVFVVIKLKIRDEEKLLIETFGNEYIEFSKSTPQLFPLPKSFRKSGYIHTFISSIV